MQQLRRAAMVYLTVVTAAARRCARCCRDRRSSAGRTRAPPGRSRCSLPIFVLSVYLKSRMTQRGRPLGQRPHPDRRLPHRRLVGRLPGRGLRRSCSTGTSAWSRLLFNNAQWVLMGLAGGLVYAAMGGPSMQDLSPSGFHAGLLAPIIVSIVAVIARQRRADARDPGLPGADQPGDDLAQHGPHVGRSRTSPTGCSAC